MICHPALKIHPVEKDREVFISHAHNLAFLVDPFPSLFYYSLLLLLINLYHSSSQQVTWEGRLIKIRRAFPRRTSCRKDEEEWDVEAQQPKPSTPIKERVKAQAQGVPPLQLKLYMKQMQPSFPAMHLTKLYPPKRGFHHKPEHWKSLQ